MHVFVTTARKGEHAIISNDAIENSGLHVGDVSVILWARHIMRVKNHGYADEEEETNGGLAG
ncbi:hypothetical protein, partial [Burkholderia ubonensis]|uniref:hypothetical protein n=1 Tax=Burkholderia ubonensis TaxID=101571 RepID=UPI001C42ECBF